MAVVTNMPAIAIVATNSISVNPNVLNECLDIAYHVVVSVGC